MVAVLIWNLLLSLSFGRANSERRHRKSSCCTWHRFLAKSCVSNGSDDSGRLAPVVLVQRLLNVSAVTEQRRALAVQEKELLTRKEAGTSVHPLFPFSSGSKGDNSI